MLAFGSWRVVGRENGGRMGKLGGALHSSLLLGKTPRLSVESYVEIASECKM